MLIYNYRSKATSNNYKRQPQSLCRRRTKLSWEFITQILVMASGKEVKISASVQNSHLHLHNIYLATLCKSPKVRNYSRAPRSAKGFHTR